ncbi:MAG TPA: hypothetical protein VKV17_06615 [Bryobacteraceae bacterium]|nr:hypothetical protein [Bryobacteraceae bacterium]
MELPSTASGQFHGAWLGNKAIYRMRMAMADGGELLVLAPGVRRFGEDGAIDALIRKFGYRGKPAVLRAVRENEDLTASLSAAAHLIHGSSEGRFRITYGPGGLCKEEIRAVGFEYAPLARMIERYNPATLQEGYNHLDGEDVYFVPNPASGLRAVRQALLPAGLPRSARICEPALH